MKSLKLGFKSEATYEFKNCELGHPMHQWQFESRSSCYE